MSPRQVFGPSLIQVTLPSVQVVFKLPQVLSNTRCSSTYPTSARHGGDCSWL